METFLHDHHAGNHEVHVHPKSVHTRQLTSGQRSSKPAPTKSKTRWARVCFCSLLASTYTRPHSHAESQEANLLCLWSSHMVWTAWSLGPLMSSLSSFPVSRWFSNTIDSVKLLWCCHGERQGDKEIVCNKKKKKKSKHWHNMTPVFKFYIFTRQRTMLTNCNVCLKGRGAMDSTKPRPRPYKQQQQLRMWENPDCTKASACSPLHGGWCDWRWSNSQGLQFRATQTPTAACPASSPCKTF